MSRLVFNPIGPPFDISQVGGSTGVASLQGNTGGEVSPTDGTINVVGAGGVTVTGNPGTSTLTITGEGVSWVTVEDATEQMVSNTGYLVSYSGGTCVLTLPATPAVGDVIKIIGIAFAPEWQITQNADDLIHIGASFSLDGTGHGIVSDQIGSSITLVCANITGTNDWYADGSPEGNISFF